MNDFIQFLRDYWFQIVAIIAFVVEFIFVFIKRKPTSIDDFKLALSEGLALVPDFVSKVEVPGCGDLKQRQVINLVTDYVQSKLHRRITGDEYSLIGSEVVDKIEVVLTTPTKKGN